MKQLGSLILLASLVAGTLRAADGRPSGCRAALLIGNSKYDGFTLKGAGRSLDLLEKSLASNGFQVTRHEELDQDAQKTAVEQFARQVPTNGIALVYYYGLAAHVERLGTLHNLLRPVKASIRDENDYRSRATNVVDMLKTLNEQSGSRVNLLFLDACWQSPVKPQRDAVRGGLVEFESGPDTVVMFAAESGQQRPVPDDDAASPLAGALAKHAGQLDESVRDACRAISTAAGKTWFAGANDTGLGLVSERPIVAELREGESPGEGFVNSVGMVFRWCPSGTFVMGSDETGSAATRDRKPVDVTLTKGFWMGEHEVTQREYYAVMRKTVMPTFTQHKNAPFWGLSEAKNVIDFCKKLTDLDRQAGALPAGWEYACPTEAEWEYACRAGSSAAYCFGSGVNELGLYANFADRALWSANPDYHWADRQADDGVGEALALVGSYRPNGWGIRDMHGNVAELVADHLLAELPGGQDPLARVEKDGRTQIRGGAWCSTAGYCESSFRNAASAGEKHNFIGFRVVLKKVK